MASPARTKTHYRMKKLLSSYEEWCKNPKNDRRADCDREIRKALDSNIPAVASVSLNIYAHWHAMHGSLAVLHGDSAGWNDIQLSLEYRWQAIQAVRFPAWNVPALVFAHFMVIDDKRAGDAAAFQIHSIENPEHLYPVWMGNTFGIFGLRAWSLLTRDDRACDAVMASKYKKAGVYQKVLDGEARSPETITAILDYHLQQATTESDYPEFELSFYGPCPIDYLLVKKLCHDCAEVDHPLLDLPLAQPQSRDIALLNLHPEYERFVARLNENKQCK